ncbi:MAG: phosphoglycolate/pyridoxal phosphate family phosphatase [Candidatus Firestonebacteria bacterium]
MLFVFDLDGVLYRENKVIKGAKEVIKYLKGKGHKIVYATNNSTLSRDDYVMKLSKMGFSCNVNDIMTSGYATGLYLKENSKKCKKVFIIGGKGLYQELTSCGFKIIREFDKIKKVDYVIVGLDRKFTYNKLEKAFDFIGQGAKLIATNKDTTYPGRNKIFPGGGSIVACVESATGINSFVIGKPSSYMLKEILKRTGFSPKDTIIVGDRLDTDILFGKTLKTKTVLVLTGITKLNKLKDVKREHKPDYVLKSVVDLRKIF